MYSDRVMNWLLFSPMDGFITPSEGLAMKAAASESCVTLPLSVKPLVRSTLNTYTPCQTNWVFWASEGNMGAGIGSATGGVVPVPLGGLEVLLLAKYKSTGNTRQVKRRIEQERFGVVEHF